jgi:plastocyanin
VTKVQYLPQPRHLAVVDESLSGGDAIAAMAAGEAAAREGTARTTPSASAARRGGAVAIANFAFDPRTLEIAGGDAVTWTNADDVPHRIQSTDDAFSPSSVLDTKETFRLTLSKPGRYDYFCSLHPKMRGTIVVR